MAICSSGKTPGFNCRIRSIISRRAQACFCHNGSVVLTRSKHEPPPKYSMTIHSLCPWRKLPRYCVTYELAHVASTDISCWMSWISSSLVSRSIYADKHTRSAILDRDCNRRQRSGAPAKCTNLFNCDDFTSVFLDSLPYRAKTSTYDESSERCILATSDLFRRAPRQSALYSLPSSSSI